MVWFFCGHCGDSIKKKGLRTHYAQCKGQEFTCVDCSRSFDRDTAQTHNQCVTEHEKYVQGATKPGGFAEQGCFKEGTEAAGGAEAKEAGPNGTEFLATAPPWICRVCNVTCTSQDNLAAHASGTKHRRKARAALGLNKPKQQQQEQAGEQAAGEQAAGANGAGSKQPRDADADAGQPAAKKAKKSKKADKQDSEGQQQQQQQQNGGGAASGAAAAANGAAGDAPAAAEQAAAEQAADAPKKREKKKKPKKPSPAEIAEAAAKLTPAEIPGFERAMTTGTKRLQKRGSIKVKKLARLLAVSARTKKSDRPVLDDAQVEAFKRALFALPQVQVQGTNVVWVASGDSD